MIRRPPRSTLFPYTTSSDLHEYHRAHRGHASLIETLPCAFGCLAVAPPVVGVHDEKPPVSGLATVACRGQGRGGVRRETHRREPAQTDEPTAASGAGDCSDWSRSIAARPFQGISTNVESGR